jgi:sugar lactone lactonase YvrE
MLFLLVASLQAPAAGQRLRLVEVERFELTYPTYVEPAAIATGPLGQLFLADVGRGTVVKLGPEVQLEFEFEPPPERPGLQPLDLEVTGFQVYVLDALSNSLLRFSHRGSYLDVLQTFADRAVGIPSAVAVDGTGRILLAYPNRHAVHIVGETQEMETLVGGFGSAPGELSNPAGVAFAADGAFFVADQGNQRLQRFDEVGNFAGAFTADVDEPRGLATGAAGLLFVADAAGAVHAFSTRPEDHGAQATLALAETQPIDVASHEDRLWVLSREPRLLLHLKVVWGE